MNRREIDGFKFTSRFQEFKFIKYMSAALLCPALPVLIHLCSPAPETSDARSMNCLKWGDRDKIEKWGWKQF